VLPIWITEYGAPTGGSDGVTEVRQAEIAADAVATAAADDGVAALFWYTYRDWNDPGDSGSYYGLLRADGAKKPTYDAFRQAIAHPSR
jgi:exo-beta-1,3-glucanase (GH17 family)